MTSDLNEVPLLSEASLMLIVLRSASRGPTRLPDCLARLIDIFGRARETLPEGPEALSRRLAAALFKLHRAGLLLSEAGGYRLTERGRFMLESHPLGIDETVLTRFPEYRAHLAREDNHPLAIAGPGFDAYVEGYLAFQHAQAMSDNPHPFDAAEHLAWESGWSEAEELSRDL